MKRNILRNLFVDSSNETEDKITFIQNRVQIVQKHVPRLNGTLKDYVNKTSELASCGEKIVLAMDDYVKAENITQGIKEQLSEFANILHEVCCRRNSQVTAIHSDVLEELAGCGKMCKNVQVELKSSNNAYNRERTRLRQWKRARADGLEDCQQITAIEGEYLKARSESSRAAKSLEEQIDIFERRRLNGLREVLLAWTVEELRFHARALELFTQAYNIAAKINVEADMEKFRNKLRLENSPRLDSSRDTSFQRSESLMHLLSTPFGRGGERPTGVGIPHPSPSHASCTTNQSCLF